jgi:hypothetical protein
MRVAVLTLTSSSSATNFSGGRLTVEAMIPRAVLLRVSGVETYT